MQGCRAVTRVRRFAAYGVGGTRRKVRHRVQRRRAGYVESQIAVKSMRKKNGAAG